MKKISFNSLANPGNSKILFHKITCGLPGNNVIFFGLAIRRRLACSWSLFLFGWQFWFLGSTINNNFRQNCWLSGRPTMLLGWWFQNIFHFLFFFLPGSIFRQLENRRRIMDTGNALWWFGYRTQIRSFSPSNSSPGSTFRNPVIIGGNTRGTRTIRTRGR